MCLLMLCGMYSVWLLAMLMAVHLAQLSRAEVLNRGKVFQVYPNLDNQQNETTPLYFALMQSFSGGYVSAGGIPGLMVALDEINSNSTVLPGYSLHYTLSDTAVSMHVRLRLIAVRQVTKSRIAEGSKPTYSAASTMGTIRK